MQVTIFRGSREVGGNCIEIRSEESRIILDVGLPLFDAERRPLNGFELGRMTTEDLQAAGITPRVAGLFSGASAPDAILLSHAHLDHVGLLRHTQPTIPVYASTGTSKMMLAGALYANQHSIPENRFREMRPRKPIQIGAFQVTAFEVDHSIYGSLAFLIEAEGKRLLYTGDLRMHGPRPDWHSQIVRTLQPLGIDALIVEGTHFGFEDGMKITESHLEETIVGEVEQAAGLVLAAFSPQNVDRLGAFVRAANQTRRIFVADAYAAFVLHLLGRRSPVRNPIRSNDGRVYYPNSLKLKIERDGTNRAHEMDRDSEISMPEILNEPYKYLMVFRDSMLGDFQNKFPGQTTCFYSAWQGYAGKPKWQAVQDAIRTCGGRFIHAHTSGHAHADDIVTFAKSINAKTIVPIHGFEPERFREHFGSVTVSTDCEPITL
ncbi:MAG TPA: hypothetical protein DDZ51_29915 [Planctomycetaceae bacterium]|nr:hypothetical protein [Planctomycetaceae bacterium]